MDGLIWKIAILACVFVLALTGIVGGLVSLIRAARSHAARPFPGRGSLLLIGGSIMALLMVTSIFQSFTSTVHDVAVRYPSPTGLPPVLYYDASDATVRPFIVAIDAVDRASLGFTPIAPHTRIALTWLVGKEAQYDVFMNVYGTTARTIAFRQQGNIFIWVAEQEIHTGPNMARTSEGTTNETISITYETVYFSGAPQHTISIHYFGDDPRLARKSPLTLADVQPILQEWHRPSSSEPPTHPA
jgi:hypothetical protein